MDPSYAPPDAEDSELLCIPIGTQRSTRDPTTSCAPWGAPVFVRRRAAGITRSWQSRKGSDPADPGEAQ